MLARRVGLGAAWLALTLAAPALAQTQAGMQAAEIVDPNGFDKPMRAATISVPAGWRYQGQVRWNPQATCQTDQTQFVFSAQDPSGRFGVDIVPGMGWQASNMPGAQAGNCTAAAFQSARDYLQALVQRDRPAARILDYRDRPDLVGPLPPALPSTVPGFEISQIPSAGEVLIAYPGDGGGEEREIIAVVTIVNITRIASMTGEAPTEILAGTALPAFAARAPAGQLDFGVAEAIRKSFTLDPEWQSRISGHQNAMAATNAKGAADRAAITAEAGRYTSDLISKGWQERQAAQDIAHEKFIRTLRGETQYGTATGGTVNLPSQYERAWQMPGGGYVMGNGGFDASRDLNVGATELTPNE